MWETKYESVLYVCRSTLSSYSPSHTNKSIRCGGGIMMDKETVKFYYENEIWDKRFVHLTVESEIITKEEYKEITKCEYTEDE